jgi:hypothetical protein
MTTKIIIAMLLIRASAALLGQSAVQPTHTADEVIARMFERDLQRETAAGGYIGNRQYDLENHRFNRHARMVVNVTCDLDGTKHLQVVSEEGWKSANSRVLRKMLESESEASRPVERPKSRITFENYTFHMIEIVSLEGRPAYVIDVVPKREATYLFRGRIWVDAEDYALARVEGEPAKNPSFWIRSVHFTQENHKSGAFWFPSSTTSITKARIFGDTEVDIHYSAYTPLSDGAPGVTRPTPTEVSYYAKN